MQLDPRLETFLLLANCRWGDVERAEMVKVLDDLGVDGQGFYNNNFGIIENYYAAFNKSKVGTPGDQLLQGIDEALLFIYLEIFLSYPSWLEAIHAA